MGSARGSHPVDELERPRHHVRILGDQPVAEAVQSLEGLHEPQPDDRLYQLSSVDQVFERATAMIDGAKEIVLFDLFPEPFRRLEGALTRLMAYASLTGATVSLATAQQVLRNIIASQEKRVTIDLIQKRVSEHFNLREQDLKVRSNTRAIAFPRQVAMYIVKQLTTASLPEIGRQFGGKHHTTVLHSIHKIEEMRRSDKDLNRTITRLMDALQ